MAEQIVTKEWTFQTADGPVEHLPAPERFRALLPQGDLLAGIARVQRKADETYEIVKHGGTTYEHLVFNPDADPAQTVGITPTAYSGARKNPGNMHEVAIDALLSPGVRFDYLSPWNNHPAGKMRQADYTYFLKTSRYTKGTGADKDPLRPTDSNLDIVDLYTAMNWHFPTYFSATAEGGRQLLGRAAAFGTSRGIHINGMPGLVQVDGYNSINVYADIANRMNRFGGSAKSLEVNGKTQRLAKKNMPTVYPLPKYLAHQAPVPAVAHPVDLARFLRINRAIKRHTDPNKPQEHAASLDLLVAMAMNDAPVTFTYGSENPLGPANEIKTMLDSFMHDFPNDLRSPRRLITLKLIENAGIDHNTHTPTGRTAIERRTLGFGAMLGLVKDENMTASREAGEAAG